MKLLSNKTPPARIGPASITIRPGYADDERALRLLAALDSAELPAPPVLLAEVDGQLRAALSLGDGSVIADPFFPTVHLVELLHTHAAASRTAPGTRTPWRARRRPSGAAATA